MLVAVIAAVALLLLAGWGAFALISGSNGDGGTTERFMHVHGLTVPGWAPDTLYLSTHRGLIRIDDDWRFVGDQRHDFMGFAHHPRREEVFFSSGHPAAGSGLANPIGFMVSEDGGVSWEPISLQGEADFHVMTVSRADPDVIYGWNATGVSGLYRSSDGGRSWERPAADPLMAGRGVFTLAAHRTDPRQVLAGNARGLWRSVDGGERWERVLADVPVTALATTSAPESVIAYLADGTTGLALIADIEDPEGSRTALGLVLPPDDAVVHVAVHPERDDVIYAGTAMEHLFVTRDGGASWQQLARAGRLTLPPSR